MADPATSDLLTLTAQIVAAHVAGNKVAPDDVPALINDVYGALARVGAPVVVTPAREPAVPIKRSIQQEYLVCLEDGAKLKILTRYLQRFGLTPGYLPRQVGVAERLPDDGARLRHSPVGTGEAVGLGNRPAHGGAVRTQGAACAGEGGGTDGVRAGAEAHGC